MTIHRKYWARAFIDGAQGATIPEYGSATWAAIPLESPVRLASMAVAAEVHARAGDTLEADLRREIAALRAGFKRGEDEAYRASVDGHRARYGRSNLGQSFVDRRTDQIAAAQPRPGDYHGGPVEWDGGDSA